MNSAKLFETALGLQAPWFVKDVNFKGADDTKRELHIDIGFTRGSRFKDLHGVRCPVHDTVSRTWQHLHFFQHLSFLHCDVPRITTSDGSTNTVEVPWARPESGFTLMFEAMALIEREMPITKVAEILGVYPQRIITNGIMEGINNKVQLTKRRARGYRNINNFINMIYFLCGKLKFSYPLYFT